MNHQLQVVAEAAYYWTSETVYMFPYHSSPAIEESLSSIYLTDRSILSDTCVVGFPLNFQ